MNPPTPIADFTFYRVLLLVGFSASHHPQLPAASAPAARVAAELLVVLTLAKLPSAQPVHCARARFVCPASHNMRSTRADRAKTHAWHTRAAGSDGVRTLWPLHVSSPCTLHMCSCGHLLPS